MKQLELFERGLARILEVILTASFFVIAGMVMLLVTLRYVFNSTIVGGNEFTAHLFIYTTALGAAVSLARSQHIAITVVVDALPPFLRRLADIAGILLIAALNGGLLVYSIEWLAQVGGFDLPVLNVPQGIVQVSVPIGCGFVLVFCATRLLRVCLSPLVPTGGPRP